jgi:hypothetical protein
MLCFTLLTIDIELRGLTELELSDNDKIDSIFYDLVIIQKDLNNGHSFENSYLTDLFKFSKLIGFTNPSSWVCSIKDKKSLILEKQGRTPKEYNFICYNNALILFKKDKLGSLIYLSSQVYFYQVERSYKYINLLSRSSSNNVIILKNKIDFIKCKNYTTLRFRFPDIESFNEVYSCFNV